MRERGRRLAGALLTAVVWLGAATAGWALALGAEFHLRAPAVPFRTSVLYLGSLALAASARWSLTVGAFHLARQAVAARGRVGRTLPWIALVAAAAPPALTLAGDLVAGDWISEQAYAPTLRWSFFTVLLVSWTLLWMWHLWGCDARTRESLATRRFGRTLEFGFWIAGAGSFFVLSVVLAGPLRPYAALPRALVFPAWLVAGTVAFRLIGVAAHPARRAAPRVAVVLLAGASLATFLATREPRTLAAARSRAIDTTVWAAATDARFAIAPPAPRRTRFDFPRTRHADCGKSRRLPPLALAPAQRRHVILLGIDTVRRDVIGKRYAGRAVAPALEGFRRDSVSFERATSPAPITLYAMGSLLTGYSVSQLLWLPSVPPTVFGLTRRLFDRQFVVLPEWSVLRRRRFTALALQGVPTVYVDRKVDPSKRFLDELTAARAEGKRIFAWLHLVEPHHPYRKHDGFDLGVDLLRRRGSVVISRVCA